MAAMSIPVLITRGKGIWLPCRSNYFLENSKYKILLSIERG
jgi:hypothetical protein